MGAPATFAEMFAAVRTKSGIEDRGCLQTPEIVSRKRVRTGTYRGLSKVVVKLFLDSVTYVISVPNKTLQKGRFARE